VRKYRYRLIEPVSNFYEVSFCSLEQKLTKVRKHTLAAYVGAPFQDKSKYSWHKKDSKDTETA
jgi:hypothetical protein